MKNNHIYLLIARKLSGEASPEELAALQEYLQANPDQQYHAEILTGYFNAPRNNITESTDFLREEKLRRILHAGDQPADGQPSGNQAIPTISSNTSPAITPTNSRTRWYAIAASVLVLAAVPAIMYFTSGRNSHEQPQQLAKGKQTQLKEVMTRSGARTRMVLPDGTKVWLNAGSKLRYSEDFNKKLREVELDGEGFFDVVKNAERPFIVHTAEIDIRVLGTAFNVKSYAAENQIEATLLRGQIEVVRKDDPSAPKVILKPNEKLTFSRDLRPVKVPSVSGPADQPPSAPIIAITTIAREIPESEKEETSWLYNRLVFEGDSFAELARKMERWYDVKIRFEGNALQQIRMAGVFEKEGLDEALQALQVITPFTYAINGKEVTLYEK